MTAEDVISIPDAIDWLTAPDDKHLSRLIKSAVSMVEQYTGYRLYERPETFNAGQIKDGICVYPIAITSVKDKEGNITDYTTTQGAQKIYICSRYADTLMATVGFTAIPDSLSMLVDACYKQLTYLYENRDVYPADLPTDVMMMLNQLRRDATV